MFQTNRTVRSLILTAFCLLSLSSAIAQNSSSSPYSRFGIGDLQFNGFARNLGMGGLNIALNHPFNLNPGNPASYSNLLFTTYEVGVNLSLNELSTTSKTQHNHNTALNYFSFGFPVKAKKWGLGFGLSPYSNVGYSIDEYKSGYQNVNELRTYKGSGGLNQFYMTNGISPAKNLSIGLTASYLFGVLNQNRTVEFDDRMFFNTYLSNSTSVGWFSFSLGAQYTFDSLRVTPGDSLKNYNALLETAEDSLHRIHKLLSSPVSTEEAQRLNQARTELLASMEQTKVLRKAIVHPFVKSDWSITTGLIFAPSASLRARNSVLAYNFKYYDDTKEQVLVRDTVQNTSGERGNLKLPLSAGFGLSAKKGNKWLMGADFTVQNWKDYSSFGQSDSLSDSWRVAAGAQFTPNERALKSYLKTVQYRAGVHYARTFLQLHETQLDEVGVSLGLGFPIRRVATMVQLTAEAGQRGTTEHNLIKERYVRVTLGFTLNDRWFIKNRYD